MCWQTNAALEALVVEPTCTAVHLLELSSSTKKDQEEGGAINAGGPANPLLFGRSAPSRGGKRRDRVNWTKMKKSEKTSYC